MADHSLVYNSIPQKGAIISAVEQEVSMRAKARKKTTADRKTLLMDVKKTRNALVKYIRQMSREPGSDEMVDMVVLNRIRKLFDAFIKDKKERSLVELNRKLSRKLGGNALLELLVYGEKT